MSGARRSDTAPGVSDGRDTAAQRRLAGRIGHDLNNLLFVIEGNLALLREAVPGDPGFAGPLGAIERSVQLAGMLAANLLTFAGRQMLHAEAVDVTTVLVQGIAALRRVLPASIEIEDRTPADLWAAHADPRLLLHAILNLGLNARDAMPDGGRLVVAADNRHLEPGTAPVGAATQAGDYVALSFQDSGSGMTEEQIAHALARHTGESKPDGDVPLGLPMVRIMAQALGGGIFIQSAPTVGTVVTLYLPRAM